MVTSDGEESLYFVKGNSKILQKHNLRLDNTGDNSSVWGPYNI